MDSQTILALNSINSKFYATVSKEFSESRQYYWHGWRELIPHIEKLLVTNPTLKVLDIGCGNGRFAKFLEDTFPNSEISYTGIDNSPALLRIAKEKTFTDNLKATFERHDIVTELLEKTFLKDTQKYDLIVSFGVVHHIPSYQLRKTFFNTIGAALHEKGIAALTLWKFLDIQRLQDKTFDFEETDVDPDQLEKNDHLVHWYRGEKTFRYCHYSDEQEQERLIKASNLKLIDSFAADGKEGKGNTYLVLKKV